MQDVTKRRGRPPEYDPNAARIAIRDVFWEHGYAATSLDALAAATQMNRPSLYGAFGDKRSMYLQALDAALAELAPDLRTALHRTDLRTALEAFFDVALRAYLAGPGGPRGCFMVSTATVEMLKDAEVRERVRRAIAETDGAIEKRIRQAIGVGELPPAADASAIAGLATALLHSLAVRARAGVAEKQLRQFVSRSLDLLLEGL